MSEDENKAKAGMEILARQYPYLEQLVKKCTTSTYDKGLALSTVANVTGNPKLDEKTKRNHICTRLVQLIHADDVLGRMGSSHPSWQPKKDTMDTIMVKLLEDNLLMRETLRDASVKRIAQRMVRNFRRKRSAIRIMRTVARPEFHQAVDRSRQLCQDRMREARAATLDQKRKQ